MLKILYLKFLLRIEIKIFFFLLKNDKTYLDLVFISSVKMYVFYNTVSLCAFWPKFHYVLYTCRVHSAGMNHAFLLVPLLNPRTIEISQPVLCILTKALPISAFAIGCFLYAEREIDQEKDEVSPLSSFNSAEPLPFFT